MKTPPTNQIGMKQLRFFAPFQALDDDQLILVSGRIRVEQTPEGKAILDFGSDDKHQYFLLDGVVEQQDSDGMRQVVEAGTERARAALAATRPCAHRVVTLSDARLLKLEGALLSGAPQEEAGDEPAGGIADHPICQAIRRDLKAQCFVLPSLPEIALRVRKAVESEQANMARLAKIIETDPAIAAKLIKAANGPLYRGQVPIESTQAAIVRIGMKTTKQLVISFSLREVFKLQAPGLKKRMQATWRHSTEVAAISLILARLIPGLDPEQALLAGLVHDIGVIPVLCYAEEHRDARAPDTLDPLIAELRGEIGRLILKRWGFSEALVRAAMHAEDWGYDSGDQLDYSDVVIVAQLHSLMRSEGAAKCPPLDQVPAFAKLVARSDGKLTPQTSLKILDQAKAEISEGIRLLSG